MDRQTTNQQNSYNNFSKARQDDRISKRNNYGPMFPYRMKQYTASKCKTGILCQNQNNQVTEQSGRYKTLINKPETVNINGNQQVRKNASFKRYTEGNFFFNKGKQKCFGLQSNRVNHDSKFLAYSPPGSYFKREPWQEINSQSVNHRKNLEGHSSVNVPTLDDHSGDNFDFNLRQITPLPPAIQSTFEISQQPSTSPLCNNRVSLLNPGPRLSVNTHNTIESCVQHAFNSKRNVFEKFQHLTEMKDFSKPLEDGGISRRPRPAAKNLSSFVPGPKLDFSQLEHLKQGHNIMKDKNPQNHEGFDSFEPGPKPDFHQLEHVKQGNNFVKDKNPQNHENLISFVPGPKPDFSYIEHVKQGHNFSKDKNSQNYENQNRFVPGQKLNFSKPENVKDKHPQNHENLNNFVPGSNPDFCQLEHVKHGHNFSKDKNSQKHVNLNSFVPGSNPDFSQPEHVKQGHKNPQNHVNPNSFVTGPNPDFSQLEHVKHMNNFLEETNSQNHENLNKFVPRPKPDFSHFEHVKHGHDSVEVKNPQKHKSQTISSNMKSCFKDNSSKSSKSYKVNFREEVKVIQTDGSEIDVQLVDNKVYKRYRRMIFKEKTIKRKKGVTLDKSEESTIQTKHPMTDSGCNNFLQTQELQKVEPNSRLVSSSFKGLSSNNSKDAICKKITEKKTETGGQEGIIYDVVTKTISEMTASKTQSNLLNLAHVKSKKSQTKSEHSINLSEFKQVQANGTVNQLTPKANLMSKKSLGYSSIKDKSTGCGEKIDEMIPSKVFGENCSKGVNEIQNSIKTASLHSQSKFTHGNIQLSCAKVSKDDKGFVTGNVSLEKKNRREGNERVTENTERQELAATTMNLEGNSSKIYVKQNGHNLAQSSEPYLEIDRNTCTKSQNNENYTDNSKKKNKNGSQMGLTASHSKVVNCSSQIQQLSPVVTMDRDHLMDSTGPTLENECTSLVKYSADENAEEKNKEQISELITCPGTLDFSKNLSSNEFSGNEKQCSKCQRSIDLSVLIYVATDDSFTGNNDKCNIDKGVLNEPSGSLHRPHTISNKNFEMDEGFTIKKTEDLYSTSKLASKIAMQNTFESSRSLLKEYCKPTKSQLQKKDTSSHSSMSGKALRNKTENKSYEKCQKNVEATSGKNTYDSIKKLSMKKVVSSETKSGLQSERSCNEAIENIPNKEEEAILKKAEKTNMTKLPETSYMYREAIETKAKRKDKSRSSKNDKTGCHRANETNNEKEDIIKCSKEEPKSSNIDKFNNDESRSDIADKFTGPNSHGSECSKEDVVICKVENKGSNNKDQTKCNTAYKDNCSKADKTNSTDEVKKHNEKVQSKFCKLNKMNYTNADLKKTNRDSVDKTSSTVRDKTICKSDTSKLYKPNTNKCTKADLTKNNKYSTNYFEDSIVEQAVCPEDSKTMCSSTDKTKNIKDSTRHEKDETNSCKLDESNADKALSNKETIDHTSEKNNSRKEDNINFAIGGETKTSTDTSIYDKSCHKADDRSTFGTDKSSCTQSDGANEVKAYFEKYLELTATSVKLADKGKRVSSMVNGTGSNKADESKLGSFLDVHSDLSSSRGKSRRESSSVNNEEDNTKHNQSSEGKVAETPSLELGKQQASNPKACIKIFQESGDSQLIHAICGEKRLVIKLTDILSDGHKFDSKTKSTDMSKPKSASACKFHDSQFKQDEDFDINNKTSKRALRAGGKDGVLSMETSSVKEHDEKEKKKARRSKRTTTTYRESPVKKSRKDSDAKGQKSIDMENKSEGSEHRSILRQYVSKMSNVHDRHSLVLKVKCLGDQNGTDEMVVKKRAISDKNDKPTSNTRKMLPDVNQAKDYHQYEYKRKCVKKDELKETIQLKSQAGKMEKKNVYERKVPPKKSTITSDEQRTVKVANISKELEVKQMKTGNGNFIYARDSVNKEDSSNIQSLDDSKARTLDKEDKIINKGVLPTSANIDKDKTNEDIKLKVNAIVKEMVKTTGKKNLSKAFKYICPACQKKFQTIADFRLHKKGSHPFLCHKCGLDFPDKASKTKHRWTHADVTFTCEQCKMRFGGEKTYRLHLGSMKHARVVAGLSGEGRRKNQEWQDLELSQAVASIQEPPVLDHAGFGRSWLSERAESSMMYSSPSDFGSKTVQKSMTLTEPRFLYADSNACDGDGSSQTTSWTAFLTEPDVSVSFDDGLTNNCGNNYLMTEFGSSNSGLYSYCPVTHCITNQSQSQVEAHSTKLHSQIPAFSTINMADIQCEWESSSDSNLHQAEERYSSNIAHFPSFGKADERGELDDTSTYHLLQNMQYPAAVEHEIRRVGTEKIQKVMLPYVSQEYNEKQKISTLSHQESVEDGDEGQSKILQRAKDMGETFSKVTDESISTKYNIHVDNDAQSVSANCHMQVCDDFRRVP